MMKRVVLLLMVDDFQGYTEAGTIDLDTGGVWTETPSDTAAGQWYHFKLVVDTTADTFDLYLDDSLLWTGAPFRNGVDAEDLDAVKFIGYGCTDSSDYVAVDNISIVPEPATMALLSLGALVMRRRR